MKLTDNYCRLSAFTLLHSGVSEFCRELLYQALFRSAPVSSSRFAAQDAILASSLDKAIARKRE